MGIDADAMATLAAAGITPSPAEMEALGDSCRSIRAAIGRLEALVAAERRGQAGGGGGPGCLRSQNDLDD